MPERPSDDAELNRLAVALGVALRKAGLKLVVAESCTGGWIAKVLTDVPGSSEWFDGGFVTYSNTAKVAVLDVPPTLLEQHGAVSEAVVREMASGARRKTGCPVVIAVSGIAGPGGGTAAKPVGLVCFGFSVNGRDFTASVRFQGNRESVRRAAVEYAIRTLREALPG